MPEEKNRRRAFGTVMPRRKGNGEIQTWIAKYIYKGIRNQRAFGAEGRVRAEDWLEKEQLLINLDQRGVQEWIPWAHRKYKRQAESLTFNEYADHYVRNHRKKNGAALTGSSRRNLRADISHLREAFGEVPLGRITPAMINEWYVSDHPEGPWAFKRECERLKAILTEASQPDINGNPAIIDSNPFVLPIPPDPEPSSWQVEPVDAATLRKLYVTMPEYTRISVYIAAMAGGMRTGELCALRKADIDLEHRTISVNGSVNRGENDLGKSRVGRTKTRHSRRTCPIPDLLMPLIRDHLEALDSDDPMFLQARRGEVIAQTTLSCQLKVARERLGLDQAITFRTLRVTHTTLMLQHGGTVREAMDEIGDATMQVVLNHYARTVPEHQRLVVNRLAEELAGDTDLAQTLNAPVCPKAEVRQGVDKGVLDSLVGLVQALTKAQVVV